MKTTPQNTKLPIVLSTIRFSFFLVTSFSLLLSSLFSSVWAQPSGAMGEHFIYLVEPGDTLSDLSERYTHGSMQWQQIQQLNQISDEMRLPIGRSIKIPFTQIPVVTTEASVVHFKGQVWINHEPIKNSLNLKTGDVIRTGSDGFLTLKLQDQSTLVLPNNSQLQIKQLNAFERSRLTDAILELQEGSVESHVSPDGNGVGRFEIHTPQSITGVRGTNLRVHAVNNVSRTEVLTGKAHLNTAKINYQNIPQAQGANVRSDGSYTIVPLLPAPVVSQPIRGRQGWQTTIIPIPQADHYVVQIALQADGASVVRRYEIDTNQLTIALASTGPGIHYAFIRAVDKDGLMGIDASLAFPGQDVLISRNGAPIVSSDGQAILLTDY